MVEIVLNRCADRVRADALSACRRAFGGKLAGTILCLPEGENICTISVNCIVGVSNALDHILSGPDVDARYPTSSVVTFAIAYMQSRSNRAPVRLASRLQFQSRFAAVQRAFADATRQGGNPSVQSLSNIRSWTAVNNHNQSCAETAADQGIDWIPLDGGEWPLRHCKVETWPGKLG